MTRRRLLAAFLLLTTATPVAIWGLLPDLSEDGGTDYMIEPMLSAGVRVGVGTGALAVAVVALVVVLSPAGRALRRNGDVGVVVPLLLAGMYTSVVFRIATSAVSGANIGGALLAYVGVVLVPSLVAIAGVSALRTRSCPANP